MQAQKVKIVFEKKGFTPNSYIDKKQYLRILQSLMQNGGEFYQEVADQLWAQAAGDRPSKQLRVNQICMTIVDAQNILRTRIKQTTDQINSLQSEKRRLQSNASKESIRRIDQIDMRLEELYGEKQSFQDDYRLVTEPFGIELVGQAFRMSNSVGGGAMPIANSGYASPGGHAYEPEASPGKYEDHAQSQQLKIMLYLTLAFGFLEIIMIYGKSDFLNLIVLTCLLSIYLMNFFDRPYIRLTLALIVASVILDLVWLILYASSKWNPSDVSNNSIYQVGYMRFIVFFTIALIPLKIGLFFFLFKHRNAQTSDKYVVSLGLMKIMLSANKSNPISKGLAHTPVLTS